MGAGEIVVVNDGAGGEISVLFIGQAEAPPKAYLNRCPHAGWPLERFDGALLFDLRGNIVCAAHGAVFDPGTGACLGGPGTGGPLTRVPLIEDGGNWILGPFG